MFSSLFIMIAISEFVEQHKSAVIATGFSLLTLFGGNPFVTLGTWIIVYLICKITIK